MPDATGTSYIQPVYETISLPDSVKNRFQRELCGRCEMHVDYWVGNLLDTIEQLGLYENSVVVFMADHGTMLGEHEQFCKGPDKLRNQVTHIPLMIRTPGNPYAGKKVAGLTEIPDVMPTLLGRLNLKSPSRVTGKDLWPLASGVTRKMHEYLVQAYGWVAAVRNQEWSYSEIWKPEARQALVPQVSRRAPLLRISRNFTTSWMTRRNSWTSRRKYRDVAHQMSAKLKEYISSGVDLTFGSFNSQPSLDTEGNPLFK